MAAEASTEESTADVKSKDQKTEASPSKLFVKNLSILPPRQSFGGDDSGVPLPPIRPDEPVASLRTALSDVVGYSHFTNYHFSLEQGKVGNGEKDKKSPSTGAIGSEPSQIVSPYTGPEAVVSMPAGVKSLEKEPSDDTDDDEEIVLDDYGDLQPLLEKGLTEGSCFRIVLERYDASTVQDHVTRIRALFDGNAPSVVSLAAEAASNVVAEQNEEEKVDTEAEKSPEKNESADEKKLRDSAAKSHEDAAKEKLPEFPDEKAVIVDGTNLKEFFYLACGEEQELWEEPSNGEHTTPKPKRSKKKHKSKSKKGDNAKTSEEGSDNEIHSAQKKSLKEVCRIMNELDEKTEIKCTIRYSGFHPPPPFRRLFGDIAYLEVLTPGFPNEPVVHVTAIPTGFYVNKTKMVDASHQFNPAPAANACFSHSLLDCLLQKSKSLRAAWADALNASKERSDLSLTLNDTPLQTLYRVATKSDVGGINAPSEIKVKQGIDSVILKPSWLLPLPATNDWSHNSLHDYKPGKTEEDLSNMFGLDLRSTTLRDWNEELQSARELPKSTVMERIERARLIHKVLTEFGEASVIGAKAIIEGHIAAMNPNEPTRTHVYFHNNIFFSRAIDSGLETFKLAQGDRAAKKAASRDASCVGSLHRMDTEGLYHLATVLVDYLGTRFVCQSVVPGILQGEKTHSLLYGAVEATAPLAWDAKMHELLEESLGKSLMIATRKIPKIPLSDERIATIEKLRTSPSMIPERPVEEEKKDTIVYDVCGPIEAKGIRGSDRRNYVLDLGRSTPRDANWVPESEGGTGKWEAVASQGANGKSDNYVPSSLDDSEWTMAVLRREMISSWIQTTMKAYLETKKVAKESGESESGVADKTGSDSKTSKEGDGGNAKDEKDLEKTEKVGETQESKKDQDSKQIKDKPSEDDEAYLKSLRLNVNVFLPNMRSLAGIDDEAAALQKADEGKVREIASFLWDEMLPKITTQIKEGDAQHLPTDGKNLTEFLQQRGINCRYMGRLAVLAAEEEEKDRLISEELKTGDLKRSPRKVMPLSWLELLECEMVARASKHVLDRYLTENGGAAAYQPAQTIASFLSAIASEREESAGETENRLEKERKQNPGGPDEEDFTSLSIFDTGGNGDAVLPPVRGRYQVWEDIKHEVGRRYRYNLKFYRSGGSSGRALYTPLLRRVCQRTGVRLVAKNYDVGGRCLSNGGITGGGGRITQSYPISPLDILDVVPLIKHYAAHGGEGFVPYNAGLSVGAPSLHILLPDATKMFEAAHLHYNARAMPQALDLAQETANLYQRVTETPLHTGIARCLDLTSAILFEAGESKLAAANAARALGLVVQLGGFDSYEALTSHTSLSHILLSSGATAVGAKHLRAAVYLLELLAGPHHPELCSSYHKLASLYHEAGDPKTALRFYQEAAARPCSDRLVEGIIAKNTAAALAGVGEFKRAVEYEKKAYRLYTAVAGDDHNLTKGSSLTLRKLMQLAVDEGTRQVAEEKKRKEEDVANAIANKIEADEVEEDKKKKKGKNKKKKKT